MNAREFIEKHNLTKDPVFVYSCQNFNASNMMHVLVAYNAQRTDFYAACTLTDEGRKVLGLE